MGLMSKPLQSTHPLQSSKNQAPEQSESQQRLLYLPGHPRGLQQCKWPVIIKRLYDYNVPANLITLTKFYLKDSKVVNSVDQKRSIASPSNRVTRRTLYEWNLPSLSMGPFHST